MTSRFPPPICPSSLVQATNELSLSANNSVQKLVNDLQQLSEDVESADVLFLCGREEDRIHAHRVILMARCKSFKMPKHVDLCRIPGATISAASHSMPAQVRLPHVRFEILRQFINYVYTAQIALQDSRVFELLSLAQDMGIEDLRSACEDYIISALSMEKSINKHTTAFIERCIMYIGENASECVKRNSFFNLTKDALIKLISSDYFCLEEEDVWRCVLSWAKKQAGVIQITSQWTEEERALVCQHLSGVIGHVRLLLIDSQVFAEEVEPTGAVPIELSLERYRHAALSTNHKSGSANTYAIAGFSHSASVPVLPARNMELKEDKRLQPRLTINMFPGSQILKNENIHLQGVLNKWYGAPKQLWRLVYRASVHGFSASAFHKMCDGIAPCLIIGINSREEISGGFTDVAWGKTNSKGGYIHSEHAFLFALNPAGGDTPIKFDILKKPYAICYHPDFGPIFGAGADLLFSSNCQANMDSYSNLPHSYDGPNASCTALFGEYNFMITDYEVYTPASIPSQGEAAAATTTKNHTNNHSNDGQATAMNQQNKESIVLTNKAKYERF